MHADAQAFQFPGLSTLRPQQSNQITSWAGTIDRQRSNEPLLPSCNVHDLGAAAKLPRLKQTQLKATAIIAHGHPQKSSADLKSWNS
jgi:hypothetical protein